MYTLPPPRDDETGLHPQEVPCSGGRQGGAQTPQSRGKTRARRQPLPEDQYQNQNASEQQVTEATQYIPLEKT